MTTCTMGISSCGMFVHCGMIDCFGKYVVLSYDTGFSVGTYYAMLLDCGIIIIVFTVWHAGS